MSTIQAKVLHYCNVITNYTHLRNRWIGDRSLVSIINEHFDLSETNEVTKQTFNRHMVTLKLSKETDKKYTLYTTAKYKIPF